MKNVLALIIYLAVAFWPAAVLASADFNEEDPLVLAAGDADGKVCPSCGAANVADAVYCYKCGQKFPEAGTEFVFCPYCGGKLDQGTSVCPHCGRSISPEAASDTRHVWERRTCGLTFTVGGAISGHADMSLGADFAFYTSDHFAFGPELAYFFAEEGGIFLLGGIGRLYILPYSRGYYLKPYLGLQLGLEMDLYEYSYGTRVRNMFYFGGGPGVDFRVGRSPMVIYLGVGFRSKIGWGPVDTYFTPAAGLRALL